MVRWMLQSVDDEEVLIVLDTDGTPLSATRASHSNFDELVEAARAHDESVYDLFDTGRVIEKKFDEVADVVNGRISVRGGQVFFDDDPFDNVVVEKILDFHREGEDFTPLAHYVANIMANPQEHSREQFYRWIENHHFPIADDGTIVAYKSVYSRGDGTYRSAGAGHAFVNGVEFGKTNEKGEVTERATIPQKVGDVVTMPRSEVAHDPNVPCHTGLHAGTWEYASTFSGDTLMLVKVNPRDVVSVPHDCTSQKVRVCRYEVIGFAKDKNEALRYVDEVVVGDKDIAEAEAEADPDDTLVDVPTGYFANSSKVWSDGDAVVVKSGHWGTDRATEVNDSFSGSVGDFVGKRGVVRHLSNRRVLKEGATYVKINGDTVALWDDELAADPQGTARKVDTRTNHLRQKRGPGGRFLPKV